MFFGQTFDISDIPRIFFLAILEILLSADNAIVLGLLVSHLAPHLRKKALYIGTASAFFFRAAGLLVIEFLIEYRWIQLLGAAYLLYLSIRHFGKRKGESLTPNPGASFLKTIILIELFDLAFAVDSIVAAIAFVANRTSDFHSKIWIVYIGGMLGLIGVRYASHLFAHLMQKFPRLETSAYLMVGWIGGKLAYNTLPSPPIDIDPPFWVGMGLLLLYGLIRKKSRY